MDIAKIRKKALSKGAEDKTTAKPLPPAPEEEKRRKEKVPAVVEERTVLHEEPHEGQTEVRGEAGILVAGDVPEEHAEAMVELLTFRIALEEYAFRVPEVEEVLRMQRITRVPTMPDYVLGITSLRGKIIPVIDLKTRLNLQGAFPCTEQSGNGPECEVKRAQEKKILIIEGPRGLIGATIDKVIGVMRLPLSEMRQPPGHLDESELRFIEAVVVLEKRFISVIRSATAMDIEV